MCCLVSSPGQCFYYDVVLCVAAVYLSFALCLYKLRDFINDFGQIYGGLRFWSEHNIHVLAIQTVYSQDIKINLSTSNA